jgi:CBS-domain-containing membrane protein
MVWARVPHPPAGATTLIVSLGILREPWQLGVLMVGVALLVVQGFVINRVAGIDYPAWAPRPGVG